MTCPELSWPASLFLDDHTQRIGTIETTPVQAEPVVSSGDFLKAGSAAALYVTIHGIDRYCAYPVETTGPLIRESGQGNAYGKLTALRATNSKSLPPGVLVGADGTAYAQMAYRNAAREARWYVVGDAAMAHTHLMALSKMAGRISTKWHAAKDHAARLGGQLSAAHVGTTSYDTGAISDLFDWSQTAIEGDPRLVDELDGLYRIGLPTAATNDADAVYNFLNDTLTIFPALIERIERGMYAVAANMLRHELTHRTSRDRPFIDPLWELVQASIAVYGSATGLTKQAISALTTWLFQTNPVQELIAYNVQLTDAERFDPATKERIQGMFRPMRDRMLQEIQSGHLPVEVFELSRDYYVDGLHQFFSDAEDATQRSCIDAYDHALTAARHASRHNPSAP